MSITVSQNNKPKKGQGAFLKGIYLLHPMAMKNNHRMELLLVNIINITGFITFNGA